MNVSLLVDNMVVLWKCKHFPIQVSHLAKEYDQHQATSLRLVIFLIYSIFRLEWALSVLVNLYSSHYICRYVMQEKVSCRGVALSQCNFPQCHIGGCPLSDCNESALVLYIGMLRCAFYSMWLMRNARYCQVALLCDWLVEYVWACRRGRIV